jgi:hypothetical protein
MLFMLVSEIISLYVSSEQFLTWLTRQTMATIVDLFENLLFGGIHEDPF